MGFLFFVNVLSVRKLVIQLQVMNALAESVVMFGLMVLKAKLKSTKEICAHVPGESVFLDVVQLHVHSIFHRPI